MLVRQGMGMDIRPMHHRDTTDRTIPHEESLGTQGTTDHPRHVIVITDIATRGVTRSPAIGHTETIAPLECRTPAFQRLSIQVARGHFLSFKGASAGLPRGEGQQ